VLGFRGVGKSAFTIRFVEKRFCEDYQPTIESTFNKLLETKRGAVVLDIIDTAGMDEISVINPRLIQAVHGYILVYSVTDSRSFDMIKKIHERLVEQSGDDNLPRVLVGTKCDQAPYLPPRQVTREEGEKLARELGVEFMETSAVNGVGIDPPGPSAFTKLIDLIYAHGEDVEEPRGGCDLFDAVCCCIRDKEEGVIERAKTPPPGSVDTRRIGYISALLTFLLGIGLLVTAMVWSVGEDFKVQQGALFGIGIFNLIASVVATVGVQKWSCTINKLHLGFLVITTIATVSGSIWQLATQNGEGKGGEILAIVVLAMLVLELPIIGITWYRFGVARVSFHESGMDSDAIYKSSHLSKSNFSNDHTNLYRFTPSRFDT